MIVMRLGHASCSFSRNFMNLNIMSGSRGIFSFEAVAALRERGLQSRRLEDGFPEWKAAGLPVEAVGQGVAH